MPGIIHGRRELPTWLPLGVLNSVCMCNWPQLPAQLYLSALLWTGDGALLRRSVMKVARRVGRSVNCLVGWETVEGRLIAW